LIEAGFSHFSNVRPGILPEDQRTTEFGANEASAHQ